jgi:uncharacterized damage-inducible protein DinB
MEPAEIQELVAYNHWANERVLRRVARLSRRQLSARAGLSHGSVLGQLVHLADVEWSWRLACQTGHLPTDYLTAAQVPTVPVLRAWWRAEMAALAAYAASLSAAGLAAEAVYSWPRARPRRRPRWQILLHVVLHGTHHRGELAHYLTARRLSPGALDFTAFRAAHRSPPSG